MKSFVRSVSRSAAALALLVSVGAEAGTLTPSVPAPPGAFPFEDQHHRVRFVEPGQILEVRHLEKGRVKNERLAFTESEDDSRVDFCCNCGASGSVIGAVASTM